MSSPSEGWACPDDLSRPSDISVLTVEWLMHLLTEDQRALRAACADVLSAHSTSAQIRAVVESPSGFDDALWKQIADLGWTSLAVPEIAGGLGGSVADLVLVAQEFGRVLQPSPFVQVAAVAWALGRAAATAETAGLLSEIASGQAITTWAVGEPGDDSILRARVDGGTVVLDGSVAYLPEAQAATHMVVAVDSGSLAIVAVDSAGLSLAPMSTIDLTRRYLRAEFAGVRVPGGAVIRDAAVRDALFDVGVTLQCAESTGVTERLLSMTVTYVGQREQFGVAIGSFQAIKHRIADMRIETDGCRVATREAADALDTGNGVAAAVSVAKSWVGRAASYVATNALQFHGGIGFSWEHDLHLYLRRAKANELLLGDVRWHDLRLAALLGVEEQQGQ